MDIHCFASGPLETNAYVAVRSDQRQAVVIDPAPGSHLPLSQFIRQQQLTPTAIFLTHTHWDHIADVKACKEEWQVPVYVHALDRGNLEQPGSDGLAAALAIEGVAPDHVMEQEQVIEQAGMRFQVLETPGHSPGGVCYYVPEQAVLFSGDTLFKGTYGTLALPTANAPKMKQSLQKLATLPSETTVYPGHGPATTIGEETWLTSRYGG